ncbi:LLM class flavin-dependent oxidoreductase [Nocardia alni]|uniref:LLM class flavin-dependent oxidoreductase n=1 Tax=Nocardia alni TaxID=2815723 RepID=UPI001C2376F7|nr:LLM class flavin-dependent oxidoreductase [Nocardia alni]
MTVRPTEFGVGFGGTLKPSEYGPLAECLERYGFHVATAFGDLMMQPPALVLAMMAGATERLRLGVGCYTPWTHHPVEIAGQMAYLDMLTEGRAFLGLVRGAWLDQLGIDTSHALPALTDTLAIIDAVLAGGETGHTGPVYSVEAGTRPYYPIHRPRLPLMIGTWSPRLARFAGARADEIQIGGCANPAMIPVVRAWADEGAVAASRDPACVGIVVTAVTVVDEDRATARALARTEAALPMHAIARLDRTLEVDPELLDAMGVLLRQNDFEAAGRLIPDDLLDHFAFCGTPEEVAEHAAAAYTAGAKRVEFDSPFGSSPAQGIRLLGERVLPILRASGLGQ